MIGLNSIKKKEQDNIILYGSRTCPDCIRLKEYLNNKKITFKYYDIFNDEYALRDMKILTDTLKIPVLVKNNQFVIGFDKNLIDELLK